MPFVQGHLRNEPLSVNIETECAHCGAAIQIEIDSELTYRVTEGEAPLIFLPLVDFERLRAPNIIDDF
jgi:hypothetical protein